MKKEEKEKERNKNLKKHNKYKIEKELKELNKVEKDIEENMEELKEEIEEILKKMDKKVPEWNSEELRKYNRIDKINEEIEEKIEEKKKKEYRIVVAFLTARALATNNEINKVLEEKEKKKKKKEIRERIENGLWSGLSLKDRYIKNSINFKLKIKEVTNLTIIKEGKDIRRSLKEIEKEVDKGKSAAKMLADTENTRMNYDITKGIVEDIKEGKSGGKEVELVYNAILDSATCEECESYDGKVYKLGSEISLPIHPNCRCAYTPLITE